LEFLNELLRHHTGRFLKNPDCRLLKKISEARRAWTVVVSVKHDREIRSSTNTSDEHEFVRGDRAHPSTMLRAVGLWVFFSSPLAE